MTTHPLAVQRRHLAVLVRRGRSGALKIHIVALKIHAIALKMYDDVPTRSAAAAPCGSRPERGRSAALKIAWILRATPGQLSRRRHQGRYMTLLLARTSPLARVLAVLRPPTRASLGRGATFTARVLRVILPREIFRSIWQEGNTLTAVYQTVGPMALEAAPSPG